MQTNTSERTHTHPHRGASPGPTAGTPGARLTADGIVVPRGARRVLDGVSVDIEPGQLVALVGPSGGGKTTLLEALAGIRRLSEGTVWLDGQDVSRHVDGVRASVAFVPQDDIIHRDLPLRATLNYAARLRLPATVDHEQVVEAVLAELDLRARAAVAVGSLSGGQRKRASIAVELLARPRLLILDEPTAGLDPTSAVMLVQVLRRLAHAGYTVLFTTHNTQDLALVDVAGVLSSEGRVLHWGGAAGALAHLGVAAVDRRPQVDWTASAVALPPALDLDRRPTTAMRQWRVLTRRNAELLVRNRLTMAIMLGAPALVVAMFVVLFTPHAFDPGGVPSNQPTMVAYWLAFAGFFFGLTYGLLQICTEFPIARRERFAGVRIGPYLASKVTVLLPVLFAVDVGMLAVLGAVHRLPALDAATEVTLGAVILLDAIVALLMGLLISGLVSDSAQATIALPMVCFPAVLFAGAILPVGDMAVAGQVISVVTPARWAFDAVGDVLRIGHLHPSTGAAFTGSAATGSIMLAVCVVVFTLATLTVLSRRLSR
jgi:ABC-type multidrug transport system ATPase subunit